MLSKRVAALLAAFILLFVCASCGAHSASPAAADTASVSLEPIVISCLTPAPTPELTPSPTPSPEPTGRALLAYNLQKQQREYLEAHPPADGDVDAALAALAIDPNKKLIALTFDDGPSNMNTGRILDVLEQYHSRATFFVIGNRIESHKEVIARAIALNCEIGSHSWAHSNFAEYGSHILVKSLQQVDDAMQANFGYTMRLFRPPYAAITKDVTAGSKQMGYPMILWSGSTHDWSLRDEEKVYENGMACAADGAVILFHDIYTTTAAAVERMVPELIEQGYQLVTVSELIAMSGQTVNPGDRFSGWAETTDPEE